MNHRYIWIAFSVFALCLLFVAQQASAAFFVPLARPPGADHFRFVQPNAVSADGSVVVGTACTDQRDCSQYEAFRWTSGGGMVSLGAGFAPDVSADGSVVVGGTHTANGFEAFRWTSDSGMVGLGYLPGDMSSWASGVSADGLVIVGAGLTASGGEAFRWTSEGGMVGLGDVPSGASSLSADGSVVIGASPTANVREAFRWTSDGGMVLLGRLTESDQSVAYDVSADGSVVVGWSYTESRRYEAFRWTSDGGMVGLGYLPGGHSSGANGISADGSAVVGWSTWASAGLVGQEAFIWDSTNGMRSVREVLTGLGVDLTDWILWEATAISADGTTIVGRGSNLLGHPKAWLANISAVPEPTSSMLLLAAGVIAGPLTRRNKREKRSRV